MNNLDEILNQLRSEHTRAQQQVASIEEAIRAISQFSGSNSNRTSLTRITSGTGKRVFSAETRRKLSLAQQARWAKYRSGRPAKQVSSTGGAKKKFFSAETRRKLAAAQRARWAKYRAGKAA